LVVAEVLTGIALVQQSVKFIKENISTAQDIGQIAGQIDDLFRGEKEAQQARNKKSGNSGLSDQFGVESVAQEIIDAKLASEKLYEVSQLVDLRFGHGTWKGILAERQKRIQEAREAALKAKREAAQRHSEMMEQVKMAALVTAIAVAGFAFFIFAVFSSF